jgi:hypothetical protein
VRCLQDVNNLSPVFQVKITLNKSKKEGKLRLILVKDLVFCI